MKTDWQQIREMLNAVIDSCEHLERVGLSEEHRSASVTLNGVDHTVQEFLISTWTLPENIRYQIIRERHQAGVDLPYVPYASRALVAMAQTCAELIGAADSAPASEAIAGMNRWYRDYAVPHVINAMRLAKLRDESER